MIIIHREKEISRSDNIKNIGWKERIMNYEELSEI